MEHKNELLRFWKTYYHFSESEIDAFSQVDRANFIPKTLKSKAYEDNPLPLLRGKTISQPTTVMIMTHALKVKPGMNVFEVGAGSGYQAAIISRLVGSFGKVISTEVIPELVVFAKNNLKAADIGNVSVFEQDGSVGFEGEAPFDRIILTCASKEFPIELLKQLKPGGIILGPVGTKEEQELIRGTKDSNGVIQLEFLGQFVFTHMYGKFGFED